MKGEWYFSFKGTEYNTDFASNTNLTFIFFNCSSRAISCESIKL